MPSMRIGRLIAAAYLLAVLVAVVVWLVSGAESAFLVTTALTLSGLAYGILGVGAMALAGVPAGLREAIAIVLILVMYPGAAVVNVISVRGIWRACRRRQLRRRSPSPV
jgi:pyrroline-5-carboxylate reductase